ncbi:MAG: adenylyltransferase/cytidyltransferase family protein [Chloroflexi bacterium]|nr:adenylyltransferase/cytidyltransferase family protein [Chloroflexota bacterium]
MKTVFVTGSFDNLRSRHIRFLEEAAKLGVLCVRLWSDATAERLEGHAPQFPLDERLYLMNAIRYVSTVEICPDEAVEADSLPCLSGLQPEVWVVDEAADNPAKWAFCQSQGLEYVVIPEASLSVFPAWSPAQRYPASSRRKVVVTGCFDWLHSGHVRFFEEVAGLGDLYVGVGHDANLRLLKGEGHPLFPEAERRYMVQSIRFVKEALITSGHGWMDAEPEIKRVGIDAYAVNAEGDKPEKRAFSAENHLEYIVLQRTPAPGLPRRQSTDLRGF